MENTDLSCRGEGPQVIHRRGGGRVHRTYLRPASKSIEHIKEHEAGEGHGGVPWRHHVVVKLTVMGAGQYIM